MFKGADLTSLPTRYAYVYAVALNSSGAAKEAMVLLEEAHQQHPADPRLDRAGQG
jgi:hypothetical protein